MRRAAGLTVVALLLAAIVPSSAQSPLTITQAAPIGELSSQDEAGEIVIRFSNPMIAMAGSGDSVAPSFFRISPHLEGTFRWADTNVLVFTPDPATRPRPGLTYRVTIDTTAASIRGQRLDAPFEFTFVTPSLAPVAAQWYRRARRVDRGVVVALRFNGPVRASDIVERLQARYEPRPFEAPRLPAGGLARLRRIDPAAESRYAEKVRAASQAARATGAVAVRVATDWDRTRFPDGPNQVVIETLEAPPPESRLVFDLAPVASAGQQDARPTSARSAHIDLEPTLFIADALCRTGCDPELSGLAVRSHVARDELRRALRVVDITDPAHERIVEPLRQSAAPPMFYSGQDLLLSQLGYAPLAGRRTYALTVDAGLRSIDGQTLGHTWMAVMETGYAEAFALLGDGENVWEAGGGPRIPYVARNLQSVSVGAKRVEFDELIPTLRQMWRDRAPAAPPADRVERVTLTPDAIAERSLDLSAQLTPSGTGLVWTDIRGAEIPFTTDTVTVRPTRWRPPSSLIQVTNLGLTVKAGATGTLVWVTRLDTGDAVADAQVTIVDRENRRLWSGRTNSDGVALSNVAPPEHGPTARWEAPHVVIAERNGDLAYTPSQSAFGFFGSTAVGAARLRGAVFSDRGVYRPGETVHVKALLRMEAPTGVSGLEPGSQAWLVVDNPLGDPLTVTTTVNEWSGAEWSIVLPEGAVPGEWDMTVYIDSPPDRSADLARSAAMLSMSKRSLDASFAVAEFRAAEHDATVTLEREGEAAGPRFRGRVEARDLSEMALSQAPVVWKLRRFPEWEPPGAIREKYESGLWTFGASPTSEEEVTVASGSSRVDDGGALDLHIDAPSYRAGPARYELEADVADRSSRHVARRAALTVQPDLYIGLSTNADATAPREPVSMQVMAVAPDGRPLADVPMVVTLRRNLPWQPDTDDANDGPADEEIGRWMVASGPAPVTLRFEMPDAGRYTLRAELGASRLTGAVTTVDFTSIERSTAVTRPDAPVALRADKAAYEPGDRARITIDSPWPQASALVTLERNGIHWHRVLSIRGGTATIDAPIDASYIPNALVTVTLVKGRTSACCEADGGDPGAPQSRTGQLELTVDDRSKRLSVTLEPDRREHAPGDRTTIRVRVSDAAGRAVRGDVTLWAVDVAVLSLTGYETPDATSQIYPRVAEWAQTTDSRGRLLSRRLIAPGDPSFGAGVLAEMVQVSSVARRFGGGQLDPVVRRDLRPLAFWRGSMTLDERGGADLDVRLPDALTTWRIMAVASDRSGRFGSAEREIVVSRPLMLRPALPRFLTRGDRAWLGAVVASRLTEPAPARIRIESLSPDVLTISGGERAMVLEPGRLADVRVEVTTRTTGRARVRFSIDAAGETDIVERDLPVLAPSIVETSAAFGETAAEAIEQIRLPDGVDPSFGALDLELSASALSGMSGVVDYLDEYPYGCAEQSASRLLTLTLVSELGDALRASGGAHDRRVMAEAALARLARFRCDDQFGYWPGTCDITSPYLSSYVVFVLQNAARAGLPIDRTLLGAVMSGLEARLEASRSQADIRARDQDLGWRALAAKVLADGGRAPRATIDDLVQRADRLPVFALAHLHDALNAIEHDSPRALEVRRRLVNAFRTSGDSAHVEELDTPDVAWYWRSNVKSTAIALDSLVRSRSITIERARPVVRWLMQRRGGGAWANTQDNAWALQALVAYARTFERDAPALVATAAVGSTTVVSEHVGGALAAPLRRSLSVSELSTLLPSDRTATLAFRTNGSGTLFYAARLRHRSSSGVSAAFNGGFGVERRYAPVSGDGRADGPDATTFAAGDLVRVTLTIDVPQERNFVALTDPLPAGFEAVDTSFATTARDVASAAATGASGVAFDRFEIRDDRIFLFATRLPSGRHRFSYLARASTPGAFLAPAARAEEMYAPEVAGRSASAMVHVSR